MGRPRTHNLDLPQNLHFRHGKYFYTLAGKWLNLGAEKDEAIRIAGNLNLASRDARLAAVASERTASTELRRLVFAKCGDRCVYCGATEKLCLDHVIPSAKGGATSERNLVVSCEECNGQKSDLDLPDFFVKLHKVVERHIENFNAQTPADELADRL